MTPRLPLHILAIGSFGAAVADRLEPDLPGARIARRGDDRSQPMHWPPARMHVLVAWRETPALAERLDQAAHQWRVPWLPVVLEHPRLRVGPLVVPGRGPCHRCFRDRSAQHDPRPEVTRALHAHLDASPEDGPLGYLPAHASIAAGLTRELLERVERGEVTSDAGVVRWIDLLSGRPGRANVVAVHGCSRCGLRRDPAERTHARLAADLQRIRTAAGTAG